MRIVNITHNDLDGIACGVLMTVYAKQHNIGDIEIRHCSYQDVNEVALQELQKATNQSEPTMLYITDISVDDETATLLDKANNAYAGQFRAILIDHHQTAERLNKYEWAYVSELNDEGKLTSGTELLAQHLWKSYSVAKDFVHDVTMYDSWRWTTECSPPYMQSKYLNDYVKLLGKKKATELYVDRILCGRPVLEYGEVTMMELSYLKTKRIAFVKGNSMIRKKLVVTPKDGSQPCHVLQVGFIFCESDVSTVCAEILENHPDVDLIISTSMPTYMSYRTSKDLPIPLGEVASRIAGGGGHPKAAGSNVNMEFINKVLDTKTDTISI